MVSRPQSLLGQLLLCQLPDLQQAAHSTLGQ